MSTTTEDFESTPLVIGKSPTTYGELRRTARSTLVTSSVQNVIMAALTKPEILDGAIRGLANVTLHLLDELERLTKEAE